MNNGPTCGAQTHMELLSGRPPDRQYKHTCTDGETDRQTDSQTDKKGEGAVVVHRNRDGQINQETDRTTEGQVCTQPE